MMAVKVAWYGVGGYVDRCGFGDGYRVGVDGV